MAFFLPPPWFPYKWHLLLELFILPDTGAFCKQNANSHIIYINNSVVQKGVHSEVFLS